MNWNAKIFSYCERGSDPSYWAEPINAASNAAFIIAALAALILWLRQPAPNKRLMDLGLVVLVFVIGIGSFLFHTYATRWAAVADTAPIALFMVLYFAYALNRFVDLHWLLTLLLTGLFYAAIWQAGEMRCDGARCLNGSLAYIPALIALLGIGIILAFKRHQAAGYLLTAGLIFALSLWLRTIDRDLCTWTAKMLGEPLGTHFLWHILNAVLLYLLVKCAICDDRRERDTS